MIKLRKTLASLLYHSGISSLWRKIGNKKIIILAYHRLQNLDKNFVYDSSVVSASVDNFKKQMEYLSHNYNVISLEKFMELQQSQKPLPRNTVIITFDDGYKDNYIYAYPILKKFKLPATIYLATGCINNNKLFWWDELAYIVDKTKVKSFEIKEIGSFSLDNKKKTLNHLKSLLKKMKDDNKKNMIKKLSTALKVNPPKSEMFLSWKEIKIMNKNNISFGAHTVNHPILTNISKKEAETEIKISKSVIEKNIKKSINSFAYPNGHEEDFSDETIKILKNNNFKSAVTYIPGWADKSSDAFKLNRVFVKYEDDMILFRNKMIGLDIVLGKIYYFFNKIVGKNR